MTRFKNLKIAHMIMISIGIVFVLGATLNVILVQYSTRQQSLLEVEESCHLCHGNPSDAPSGLVHHYGPERSFHREIGDAIHTISIRIPLSAALKLFGEKGFNFH